MCENCPNSETCLKAGKRRHKLWELPSRFHCSIIGTCFGLDELYKVAKKFKLQPEGEQNDYNFHGMFVGLSSGQGRHKAVARHLSKQLDTKFFTHLGRVRGFKEERDLREYWAHAVETGNVAGAYWALLTHPAASVELREHLFGDVHMLSHLSGASVRIERATITSLEKKVRLLETDIENARIKSRNTIAEKEAFIRIQGDQLETLARKEKLYEEAVERLKHLEDINNVRSQQIVIDELQRHLQSSDERMTTLEKRLEEKDRRITLLDKRNAKTLNRLEQSEIQVRALEATLSQALNGPGCDNGACPVAEQGGDFDLCGRCIVFVGGRSNQTPHFKELVERYNGQFLHHDGGLENGQGKLESLLAKADAVLFPVDCVSHNATRDIKRFCKQGRKPFFPLPSSGLSNFSMGLQEAVKKLDTLNP